MMFAPVTRLGCEGWELERHRLGGLSSQTQVEKGGAHACAIEADVGGARMKE